jgi:hypothetical protein
VALVTTDVSEEHITSIIRVKRISELAVLAVTSNGSTMQRNTNYMRKEALQWDTREMGERMEVGLVEDSGQVAGIGRGRKGLWGT